MCVCVTCLLSHAVCAEAFNPDEDEEEKEPLVSAALSRALCAGSQRVSSQTCDGVARGFAGHSPENGRAEAAAAGGLPGHPPLQEFGSGERSSAGVAALLPLPDAVVLFLFFSLTLGCFAPRQEEMSQVLDAMFEKFCTEGEHIIDQDDDGDNFYVIER